MTLTDRTPWFPIRTLPVRQGLYEYRNRKLFMGVLIAKYYWNGFEWICFDNKLGWWRRLKTKKGDQWRGLTEQYRLPAPAWDANRFLLSSHLSTAG